MEEPHVTVSDRLAAYLEKKGCRYILLAVATCKSCGGAVGELYARPAKEREAARLLTEGQPDLRQLPCLIAGGESLVVGGQPVELLVSGRSIELDSQITLDLRRTLGLADIRIEGARF